MQIQRAAVAAALLLVLVHVLDIDLDAQLTAPRTPRVELRPAPAMRLPGNVDSNSPAIWQRTNGWNLLFVMTSSDGRPSTTFGFHSGAMGRPRPIVLEPWPGGGILMEAVIADVDRTWYGYYHNENVAEACGTTDKVVPRIGAARSRDYGRTWEPLGLVLEASPRSYECASTNDYLVGGIGDFSVMLDADSKYLYFLLSTYPRTSWLQGVSVARLAWADRDAPEGKIEVWRDRIWGIASGVPLDNGALQWIYPVPVPIFRARRSWHTEPVDAFWGPSVHWNTHLEQYVMLLSRARDGRFLQEGIYVSFAPTLDDPRLWSTPVKILDGGEWYPQIIGTQPGVGTDKLAGEWARFFMAGTSNYTIRFIK